MRHLKVTDSAVIESIGFDNAGYKSPDFGAMEVTFQGEPDLVYRYENVPAVSFAGIVGSPSIGKAFIERFKKTKHPFTKSQRAPTLKK